MSRRAILFFCTIVFAALVIQVSVLPTFVRNPFKPDLLLIIMVFIALRGSFETGAIQAWLLGMLNDVCSGLFLGLNSISFLISFFVIKSVSDRLYADSAILFVLTVTAVTTACLTINLLLLIMFTNSPGIASSIISDGISQILVNAFVASLVSAFSGFDAILEPS